MDPQRLARCAEHFRTPCFVYDAETIRQDARRLRAAMPAGAILFYAVKANPAPSIVRLLAALDFGAEVASGGELDLVLGCGIEPSRIVFSGPAKSPAELEAATRAGLFAIQVESIGEIAALQKICQRLDTRAHIALRVQLEPGGMAERRTGWGGVSPFGMDRDALQAAARQAAQFDRIRVVGVHNHQGSQYLDAGRLVARYAAFSRVAAELGETFELKYVNFGGGFGAPFYADDVPLDLEPVRQFFADLTGSGGPFGAANPAVAVEPGRFLVGTAGHYLTRVVDVKRSFGVRFALLDGGVHHMLGLSGTMRTLRRPVSVFRPGTPAGAPTQPTELAGPLCTPIDRLAGAVELPCDLAAGDLLAFANCGAYAKHASPVNFLGHDWPAEVLVDGSRDELLAPAVRFTDLPGLRSAAETGA
jgi:diaminopimelate decarboxylase